MKFPEFPDKTCSSTPGGEGVKLLWRLQKADILLLQIVTSIFLRNPKFLFVDFESLLNLVTSDMADFRLVQITLSPSRLQK